MSVTFYCATIDADCFSARLALALKGLEYVTVAVDAYPGLDPDSRAITANGPLPILRVGEATYTGLDAVLQHLGFEPAEAPTPEPRHGQPGHQEPGHEQHSHEQHSHEQPGQQERQGQQGLSGLRMDVLAGKVPDETEMAGARRTLLGFEDEMTLIRLTGGKWFAGDEPGHTDLIRYPAVALSRDIGLEHGEFPALRHWLRDVRALAPEVAMPGILDPI